MIAFRHPAVLMIAPAIATVMLITTLGLAGAVDRLSDKIEALPDQVRRELRDLNAEFREATHLPTLNPIQGAHQ